MNSRQPVAGPGFAQDVRSKTVKLPSALLLISSVAFAATGVAYLVAPGLLLSVVGIGSTATSDFLLRTVGVAMLCAAAFVWAAHDGRPTQVRIVLAGLSAYYILSSVVDLAAFAQGVVGPASLPSAAARVVIGGLCVLSAARLAGTSRE